MWVGWVRRSAPKHWMLDKLAGVFAPKPTSGPHKERECLPLMLVLRNRLKYALTGAEVIAICMQRLIKVDGKVRLGVAPLPKPLKHQAGLNWALATADPHGEELPDRLHGRDRHRQDGRALPRHLRPQGPLCHAPHHQGGGGIQDLQVSGSSPPTHAPRPRPALTTTAVQWVQDRRQEP